MSHRFLKPSEAEAIVRAKFQNADPFKTQDTWWIQRDSTDARDIIRTPLAYGRNKDMAWMHAARNIQEGKDV